MPGLGYVRRKVSANVASSRHACRAPQSQHDQPIAAEPLDLEALVRSVPQAFDDLREPSAAIALPAVAESVDEAAADAVVVEEPAPEAEQADPDATSVSTIRPAEVVEASASGPHEPSP